MLSESQLEKLFETYAYDRPRTKAMRNFLKKEAPHRVTGLSIEPDGVFIYTDSFYWEDDAGAGTWREDSETEAIKVFRETVQPGKGAPCPRCKKRTYRKVQAGGAACDTCGFGKVKKSKRRKNNVSRKYYVLYDITSDISFIPVDGKSEYGDMAHAKKRANEIHKQKVTWGKTQGNVTFGYIDNEAVFAIAKKVKPQTLRSRNPVKKKTRKKNPQRVTEAWLEKRIALVNTLMGNPETAYTKTASGLKNNEGHLYIDHAYGGVGVEQMSSRGANDVSQGHVPKRELDTFIDGMLAVLRIQDQGKRGRNPLRKKVVKKPRKIKKKDYVIFRYTGKDNVMFLAVNSAWVGKANKGKFVSDSLPYIKRIAGDVANQFKRDQIGVAERGATVKNILASLPGK